MTDRLEQLLEKLRERRRCFELLCDLFDRAKVEGSVPNMQGALLNMDMLYSCKPKKRVPNG